MCTYSTPECILATFHGQSSANTHGFYSPSSTFAWEAPPTYHSGLEESFPLLEARFYLSSTHPHIHVHSLPTALHYSTVMLMGSNSWSCMFTVCIPHKIEDHSFHRHPMSPVLT